MFFKIPTLVYQQENCVIAHGKDIAKFGKTALIVTGKSSNKNGSLNDVTTALKEHNICYYVVDTVQENPPVESVMEMRNQFLDKNIDFVIGLGGGSAIDSAKAVAVMLYFKEEDETFLYKPLSEYKYLPVVAIPTTCGTGSEVTGACVITRNDKKTKQSISSRVYPQLALVDSKYLESMPLNILCNTAVDALAHMIETVINTTATKYSDMVAFEGLKYWQKCKEVLTGKKANHEDYENLMLASTLGGMSIAHGGTSLPHGASYTVTYNTKMPHGKACGYFLYGYMKYADQELVGRILKTLDFENLEQFKDFIVGICHIEKLPNEILELALEELASNEKKLSFCPYDTSKETIRKVIYSL